MWRVKCAVILSSLLWNILQTGLPGFSRELALHIKWSKYWSFSLSISPSNEYSGLISFRIDWLDLLAVQGALKRLLHTTVQKHQFFGASVLLYGPTLKSVHDYCKDHSFDYTDLCRQSGPCFLICCLGLSSAYLRLLKESEEKLKSLLMKVKEENGKSWLKAQHSEN